MPKNHLRRLFRVCDIAERLQFHRLLLAAVFAGMASIQGGALGADDKPAAEAAQQISDPFGPLEPAEVEDPFENQLSDTPVDAAAYAPRRTRWNAKQVEYQAPTLTPPQSREAETLPPIAAPVDPTVPPPAPPLPTTLTAPKDPCAAARFKPLTELGISIAQPAGQSPTDFAGPCWQQINAGPSAACRCWSGITYQWDATCLCYQPLYFEEINAERHGYICNDCFCYCGPQDCWQSAASAAHFFGTIPCLPYCILAECPTECVYTLGHYRPGTCGTPWRWHWPPCDPLAAAGAAGIYTGLIFAIP